MLVLLTYAARRSLLERWLRKRRRVYTATGRPEALEPQLHRLAEVALRALGTEILTYSELNSLPTALVEGGGQLHGALVLCAHRFGVDPAAVHASFAHVPDGVGADVEWEQGIEARVTSKGMVLSRSHAPVRWRLRVGYDAQGDPPLLLARVAHEMAHIALKSRGVWYDDTHANELLTDVVAVLAGFGPAMRSSAYCEQRAYVLAGRMGAVAGTNGYLHERSIDFMMGQRATFARDAAAIQPSRSVT